MTTREEFEAEFQSRTLAYHPGLARATEPLVIVIGEDAHMPVGHALLTILSNLVARAHRDVLYAGEVDVPLLWRDPLGATSLAEATVGRARSVNPFISVDVVKTPPRHSLLTLGVGTRHERGVELGLGCAGWVAQLEPNAPVGTDRASIWGAALAACLGATPQSVESWATEPFRSACFACGTTSAVGGSRGRRSTVRSISAACGRPAPGPSGPRWPTFSPSSEFAAAG